MKSAKLSFGNVGIFENPRLVDRLIAVCSVLLMICLLAVGYLALQPTMNPRPASNLSASQVSFSAVGSAHASTPASAEGNPS